MGQTMNHRAAGVTWGFLPSLVVVLTLPLSAATGWPAQSIGNVVFGVTVITMTAWVITMESVAWRWLPVGFALGLGCIVAVSAVFPKLLLPNVPFAGGLSRQP